MGRWHYLYSGLRVASELKLPEWAVFEETRPPGDTDVSIRLDRYEPAETLPILTLETVCLRIPEVATYTVRGGREISIATQPAADTSQVRLFLLGSVWAALCYQRGLLAVHASVVQVGERAVAFCGASGSGKSSVAAWLMERGHGLVSDDLCRLDLAGGTPRVHPSAPRLKLWQDALRALDWRNADLERDAFRFDKFHLPGACDRPPDPLPLGAIYLLDSGAGGLDRLTGVTALRLFVSAATYRGDLLEPMGIVAAHWERCADLVRRVPVWRFTRPRDWATMGQAMDLLTAHWRAP